MNHFFFEVFIAVILLYFGVAGLYGEMGSKSDLFSHVSNSVFLLGCPREVPGDPDLTCVIPLYLSVRDARPFPLVTLCPFIM